MLNDAQGNLVQTAFDLKSSMFSICYATLSFIGVVWAYSAEIDDQGWETLQVVPHVSGLRVESPIGEKGFIGYTEAWELIVEPNVPVTVIIFGYWLDKVEYITFTDSICLTSEFNISRHSFTLQTETRIELKMSFPNGEDSWRLCVKQQGRLGELLLIDDDRTWINTKETLKEHYLPLSVQVGILGVLFTMSALFSGLNLGLMTLSIQELNLIIKSALCLHNFGTALAQGAFTQASPEVVSFIVTGTKEDAKNAEAILPIRMQGNYLLCTILIVNVVVNAAISILLEDLTTGTIAFVASSAGILLFGEITPQSVCVKHGLEVGARTIWITRFFMFITAPISYPISKILDYLIGDEVGQFDRGRLIELLKMSTEAGQNKEMATEVKIAVGAMEFANKVARDVMTRIDDVFMLSENDILDAATLTKIIHRGYTRIPVYVDGDRNKVRSLLFVKDLALIDKKNNIAVKAVAEFHERQLRIIDEDMPLPQLLDEFKEGNYHLAMVRQVKQKSVSADDDNHSSIENYEEFRSFPFQKGTADSSQTYDCVPLSETENDTLIGLVTLEDLLEEILQSEILDESDSVLDNVSRYRRHTYQTRVSEVFCCEAKSDALSLNMLQVVTRWLTERHVFFSDRYMEERAREKMIQTNIRHVILVTGRDEKGVCLYECGVASRRFILILEGTATVSFPKVNMSFEVGPWSCFGETLFHKISASVRSRQDTHVSMSFTPDFELRVQHTCRFLQLPIMAVVRALRLSRFVKEIRTPKASTSEDDDPVPLFLGGTGRSKEKPHHKFSLAGRIQQQMNRSNNSTSVSLPKQHASSPALAQMEEKL